MVAPLVAVVAVAAATAIAQAYESEKARGANAKVLKDLKNTFDKIVPPEYDVSINDPPKYIEESLSSANLDFSRVTPEEFKVIGRYSPETASYVAESNPTLLKGSAEMKEGRQAQIDALRQFKKIARGNDPSERIMQQRALADAQAAAESRTQTLLDNFARKGRLGGGLSFAAALQGSSDAMQRGSLLSQNALMDAYKNKLSAIRESGQMGRQLASDELGMERSNADVINDFNMRTSRAYQDYLNQRANMANEAERFNLGREQDIANLNTRTRNEADRFNLENRNRLLQQSYENKRSERDYQNRLAADKAAWAAKEKARQNDLRSQSYRDEMDRARSRHGLGTTEIANRNQAAADRNSAISGLGQAVGAYYGAEDQRRAESEARMREDERYDKYLTARYGARP